MKRSKPLARTSSLKRATAPLSRSKPLGRGNGRLKRSRREKAILSLSTMAVVHARQLGLCACGCGGKIASGPIGWHHVFPKAKWPELIDVAENVVGVTANCHANHETASKRLTLTAVRVAIPLAKTPSMVDYLDNTYA